MIDEAVFSEYQCDSWYATVGMKALFRRQTLHTYGLCRPFRMLFSIGQQLITVEFPEADCSIVSLESIQPNASLSSSIMDC